MPSFQQRWAESIEAFGSRSRRHTSGGTDLWAVRRLGSGTSASGTTWRALRKCESAGAIRLQQRHASTSFLISKRKGGPRSSLYQKMSGITRGGAPLS
jgi:hypothetical protein